MSNDLVKAGQAYVATSENLGKDVGGALVKTGVGGAVLWAGAGLLPFVTFPMLLVLVVLLGGYLYVKN